MVSLWKIAAKSARQRKTGLALAMISISLSVFLLLGIDKLQKEAESAFLNAASGTDLIVGARGGSLNLLLYSLFGIGSATNNVSYETYEKAKVLEQVAWTVPISLGDSHRGFRVIGTDSNFFEYYRYGAKQKLRFKEGLVFDDMFDTVIGSDVANKLGYRIEQEVVVSHGAIEKGALKHDDKPFRVVGILAKTGTPVDQAVLVSLEGFEAMHLAWLSGAPGPFKVSAEQARKFGLKPKALTAFYVGLKNRVQTFKMQRYFNEFKEEPLTAILPGVALQELWRLLSQFKNVLFAIGSLVFLSGFLSILITLLSTLNERRREISILKSIGARIHHIFALFALESAIVVLGGIFFGSVLLYSLLYAFRDIAAERFGVVIHLSALDSEQFFFVLMMIPLAVVFSIIPAFVAYRRSLKDGLNIKC